MSVRVWSAFVDKKRDVGHDQAEEYLSLYLVIHMDQIPGPYVTPCTNLCTKELTWTSY